MQLAADVWWKEQLNAETSEAQSGAVQHVSRQGAVPPDPNDGPCN